MFEPEKLLAGRRPISPVDRMNTSDVRVFKANVSMLFLATFDLSWLGCFAFGCLPDEFNFEFVAVTAFLTVYSWGWAILMGRLGAVVISAEGLGLRVPSPLGPRRWLPWPDLKRVRAVRWFGLRWLVFYPATGRRFAWLPLDLPGQCREMEMLREIGRRAPRTKLETLSVEWVVS
jgi:hypothetical protein